MDCTPWVVGGLWPAELSEITAENAALAEYLNDDLQRIVHSTNERLSRLGQSGLVGPARQAEEERVIKLAREHAVLRVQSTVRHIHNLALRAHPPETAEPTTTVLRPVAEQPVVEAPEPETAPEPAVEPETEPATTPEPPAEPATDQLGTAAPKEAPTEELATGPLEETTEKLTTAKDAPTDTLTGPEAPTDQQHPVSPPDGPTEVLTATIGTERPTDKLTPKHAAADPERAPAEPDSGLDRLQRLLAFVARQQPELRWAVGDCADGTTVLVTDLAHGWIPPGITLPAGVRLLEPGRRDGNVAALLGPATLSAAYTPGDRLGWATDFAPVESSLQPRELPPIDDLGWLLGEATHWRDGLPRLAHTLAKAGAAGTGVVDTEMNLLQVHLDTARSQLLGRYPDVDAALLINTLLLAATAGIAAGDTVSATYHFAWFQALSAPPASHWDAHRF